MNHITKLSCALATLSLTYNTAQGVEISYSDLPATIQSCVTNASCFVDYDSAYDVGSVSAFQIAEGSEDNYLVRYALAPPSAQSRLDPPLNEDLSGYLWISVKSQYSDSETDHPITLYLDRVTPAPFSLLDQSGDLSLLVTTGDLVAGSGSRVRGLDGNNQFYDMGNLSGEIPLPCAAENCEAGAQLNLTQLSYAAFGGGVIFTGFNPSDTRSLVFAQYEHFLGFSGDSGSGAYDNRQSFHIAAVPLPGALWLFVSGLGALVSARRK